MSAELVQTVRLYWPVEHTEQSVHVVAPPSENFPAEQDWQAEGLVWPIPVKNSPGAQKLQFCEPSPRQPPTVPAGHGFGHARMIIGVVVSPRKAYRADSSVGVSALW